MSVRTHLYLDEKLENSFSDNETTKVEDRVNSDLKKTGKTVDLSTECFEQYGAEVLAEVSEFDLSCYDKEHLEYLEKLDKNKKYWVSTF